MTFKTTDDISLKEQCAPVIIGGVYNLPTFYIDRRTYDNGVWTVEALDRCAFLDIEVDTSGWTKTDGQYMTSAFAGALRTQCGFGSVDIPYTAAYIDAELIDGMTFQSVLSAMATAYCGFFCSPSTTTLDFVQYSTVGTQNDFSVYSRINDKGTYNYGSVKVTNGDESTLYGGSAKPRLDINNSYALADGGTDATQLYQPITTTTFTGWSVDNAVSLSASMPYIGGTARFASGSSYISRRVTRAEGRFVGSDFILSLGQDLPDMGEINRRGLLQQKLDDAVSVGKAYGTWLYPRHQSPILVPNTTTGGSS